IHHLRADLGQHPPGQQAGAQNLPRPPRRPMAVELRGPGGPRPADLDRARGARHGPGAARAQEATADRLREGLRTEDGRQRTDYWWGPFLFRPPSSVLRRLSSERDRPVAAPAVRRHYISLTRCLPLRVPPQEEVAMFMFKKTVEMPSAADALKGRATAIPTASHHFVNGRPLKPPFPDGMETAIFGLGCFWGAERKFWELPDGVYVTAVGYAGGHTPNPTDLDGCTGRTVHHEVVLVVCDP